MEMMEDRDGETTGPYLPGQHCHNPDVWYQSPLFQAAFELAVPLDLAHCGL